MRELPITSTALGAAAITFGAALATYISTAPPTLTWANHGGDGGELITAAVTLGVPHPPGYPTYILLGKLFSWLPVGTVAYRFHLLSALAMAVAAGLVTAVVRERSGRAAPAIAAGLLLAWSPLVWGQAVIAEVYALNLAVVALLLWALVAGRTRLAGFALGLSVTTHLTALLLFPLAFYLTPLRRWRVLAPFLLLGLAPLLILPILARGSSPVVWGRPDTIAGWWWLVSGALYRPNLLSLPTEAWAERAAAWLPLVAAQFGWLGWLALPRAWPQAGRLGAGLVATAGLYAAYAFTYRSEDAIVNLLPALLLLSIVLGFALQRLPRPLLLLPLLLLGLNYGNQDLSRDASVEAAIARLYDEAPPNAILMTSGDPALFTLWYYHYVERRRPDTSIVDQWLIAFDWRRERLRRELPTLVVPDAYDLAAFRAANGRLRPICPVDSELRLLSCE